MYEEIVYYYMGVLMDTLNINLALSVIALIGVIIITKRKNINRIKKVETMFKAIIVIVFINIFLIMQSIGVEALLETLSGVMLDNRRGYVESSLSVNTVNFIVYLLFIIFIYKFSSIKKSLFFGYTMLLFPYYELYTFYFGDPCKLKSVLNVVVMFILGVIIIKYILDNYTGIEKTINEKVKIRFRYLFIPVFGFVIIFLKMVINNSIGYVRILILFLFSILYYIVGFIFIFMLVSEGSFLYHALFYLAFIFLYKIIVYSVIYSGYKKRGQNE